MRPRADPQLGALVPPLSPGEHAELEASLVREGCRDPLAVWEGRGVLLDGNHRFEICERRGLPYTLVEINLPDDAAAREWVVRNQLARRNLTPYQRAELALALKPRLAAEAKENQRRGGGSGPSGRQNPDNPRDVKHELAALAGVSHDTIAKVEALRERSDEQLRTKVRSGELSVHAAYEALKRQETEAKREARRQENRRLVETAPSLEAVLTNARFATIVADPPWRYGADEDWDLYGCVKPEYGQLSVEEICALPVARYADEDCHLYLWATNRLLPEAFRVVEAWGFRYVTMLTWCKPRIGLGQHFRISTEHVLFCVKGSQPVRRHDVGTWFEAPRGRHSEKPAAFYEIVETCSPAPYLELFARKSRPGWVAWGAEAPAA